MNHHSGFVRAGEIPAVEGQFNHSPVQSMLRVKAHPLDALVTDLHVTNATDMDFAHDHTFLRSKINKKSWSWLKKVGYS